MKIFKQKGFIIPFAILLVVFLASAYHSGVYEVLFPSITANESAVHILNIGESKCSVIECNGKYAVLDAGIGTDGGMAIENKLYSFGIKEIDLLILSSADSRNIGGALKLLDAFSVKKLVCADGMFFDGSIFSASALSAIKRNNIEVQYVNPSAEINFSGAIIEFLPLLDGNGAEDYTFTISVDIADNSFLFSGGANPSKESPDRYDVYIASEYDEFLHSVLPDICVISSVEKPGKKFSEKLNQRGIRLFATSVNGDITFLCDSNKIVTEK